MGLRKFIRSVSVASLPIVQWKPPPLRVVEAVVLRSVDDLRFPSTFAAVPPRSVLFSVFHKYIRTLLRKNPPSDDLLTVLQQKVRPSTIAGQRNVDIQRVMQITRPPKPKPKPKPKPGKPVAKPVAPPPPPDTVHPLPNLPQGIQDRQPNLAHSNQCCRIGCSIRMGGGAGADNASDDEYDGPEVALFAVHNDSDDSSVSDDDDVVAILDEEEVFGQETSQWDSNTCCLHNVPDTIP